MPQLSIITINLNNAKGLQKTIESVINQTFTDYEYVIIDGGSSDGSVELIKRYADKIDYWISEQDKGIYNAMNKGIRVSKGEYCLFLNSGDYLLRNDILEILSPELKDEAIIYGNGRMETKGANSTTFKVPNKLSLDYFSSNSLFHPSSFIKRTLFDIYGPYNESNKIVSDWEFFLKTIMVNNVNAKKIHYEITATEDDGISRSAAHQEVLIEEIHRVLNNYFPPAVLSLINDHKALQNSISKKGIGTKLAEMLHNITKLPLISTIYNSLKNTSFFFRPQSNKENPDKLKSKFTEIFNKNLFLGEASVSGPGSDLIQTHIIRNEIPKLLNKYAIKSFIDAPCGDFFWMRHMEINDLNYIGLDIVEKIIEKNIYQFGNDKRKFFCKNIVSDPLPDADLILIRDCWVHLNNKDVFKSILNLKRSNIKYLLTTSFPGTGLNEDLSSIWHSINLEIPPFNFPKPLGIINEGCTEGDGIYADKSLLLWEISKLPDP